MKMLLFYLLYSVNLKLLSDTSILISNKYNKRINSVFFLTGEHTKAL